MKIIISPAKKMKVDNDLIRAEAMPCFLAETQKLAGWIRSLSIDEAQKLWACNDKIADLNYRRFQNMDLEKNLTAALLAYEGIQYQYMAPSVFSKREWSYVQEHLRILSGFYGVLKPLDGVTPYRLEMQAKAALDGKKNLYDFWENRLYEQLIDESRIIVNLASKEYAKCIEPYLRAEDQFITCIFGEEKEGKIVQKGTQVKMARGDMVRFMAEKQILQIEELKGFNRLRYLFREDLSSEREYVFVK